MNFNILAELACNALICMRLHKYFQFLILWNSRVFNLPFKKKKKSPGFSICVLNMGLWLTEDIINCTEHELFFFGICQACSGLNNFNNIADQLICWMLEDFENDIFFYFHLFIYLYWLGCYVYYTLHKPLLFYQFGGTFKLQYDYSIFWKWKNLLPFLFILLFISWVSAMFGLLPSIPRIYC